MIDLKVRVHDKFSVEFKTGYVIDKKSRKNDFMMNTWIFVPYSLDINSYTYGKEQFYRDVKSYVRLITPVYTLAELADEWLTNYVLLRAAFVEMAADPSGENMADFEYRIKMFISIAKSAMRREVERLMNTKEAEERVSIVKQYVVHVERVTQLYRRLRQYIDKPDVPKQAHTYYSFGDEFLSNRIEHKTYNILNSLKDHHPEEYALLRRLLLTLVRGEVDYRVEQGYEVVSKTSPDKNSTLIFRLGLLKKYIENHLFLNARREKDGRIAEQVYFSLAAGISMIFATIVAFSFQQKFGNFTIPLFVALVVSYMLKDRIKEIVRFYFAHRLSKKFFDNKTTIGIKNTTIGWIKEGFDFTPEHKVPQEIMVRRKRSDILESDNRNTAEKIILYRKLIRVKGHLLNDIDQCNISGINDIVRFNISNILLKMDNSEVPLSLPTSEEDYETIYGRRIYYINFILQLKSGNSCHYTRIRLIVSRDGIEKIEGFKAV